MNDNSATKSVYLAIQNIQMAWTQVIANWGIIFHQYKIIFEDRCRL
jgi:transposase-like protein